MKRYGDIYDKMRTMENLREAHRMAKKDKALYVEVQMVNSNPDYYLGKIRDMMLKQKYHISADDYSVSVIRDKTKQRELWKLKYYPHRIIQWAIMLQIEKVFYKTFCNFVCASLKGRGGNQVMHLMDKFMKDKEGTKYCLKFDIRKFYPSINHRILKRLLRRKFKDEKALKLLDMIIDSFPGRKGLPIGSYLSQFLANYYLAFFDHRVKEELKCKYVVRYMDDIVILGESTKNLRYIRKRIKAYLGGRLSLDIKNNWQIFPTGVRGVDFVGYRYFYGYKLLRKRTCKRMKKKLLLIYTNNRMNFKQWCSINSYIGWLKWCNSYRLKHKRIMPLLDKLLSYYYSCIGTKKSYGKTILLNF